MSAASPLPEDQLALLAGELEKHELYARREEYPRETQAHPSLKQELERKTLAELQRLVLGLEHGKFSPAQFNAAIESLWMTTAGLVAKETMDLIGMTKAKLIDAEQYTSAVFVRHPDNDAVMVVKWQPGTDQVSVSQIAGGKQTNSVLKDTDGLIPSMDAKRRFITVCEGIQQKGWRRV